jgi:beta-glucosidase
LKGFAKVFLQPQESRELNIGLDKHAFAFWDEEVRAWVCEQGEYRVLVGSSSQDIRLEGRLVIHETWRWTGL